MKTFHVLLDEYYKARTDLDEYVKPFLHLMKKGKEIADQDSQKIEQLGGIVNDLENRLYAYRGANE